MFLAPSLFPPHLDRVSKGVGFGIGSEIHTEIELLLHSAFTLHAPFLAAPNSWYRIEDCPIATRNCLELPYSSQCFHEIFQRTHGAFQDGGMAFFSRQKLLSGSNLAVLDWNPTAFRLQNIAAPTVLAFAQTFPTALAELRSSAALRKLFLRALGTRLFIDHIRPEVLKPLEESVAKFSLPHPVASIHVRHGDKHSEMKLLGLGDYIHRILPIMYVFGIRNIFLSTEDQVVIESATHDYSMFHWFFTPPGDQRKNPDFKTLRNGNRTANLLYSLLNLFLASSCDVFVGTRMSNWNRLIDEAQRSSGSGGTYYVDAHNLTEQSPDYVGY